MKAVAYASTKNTGGFERMSQEAGEREEKTQRKVRGKQEGKSEWRSLEAEKLG